MNSADGRRCDPQRAQTRRNQVLDAAECCFSRSGFHGASMAEISKAAGMSAGHIYNYFASKDEIIAALVQRHMEDVSLLMSDLEGRDDPLQAMLDGIECSMCAHREASSSGLLMEIHAEATRNPAIAKYVQQGDEHGRALLRAIVVKGRKQRGLSCEETMLEGRLEVICALFQGLDLRTLCSPQRDETQMFKALRLALEPLLLAD
jgi:AcrR family transcriptional regulator